MMRARELAAAAASPSYRRWRGLLRSLQFDPDSYPGPWREPGPRDFIICGVPRSGTALLTAALFQPPQIVTVMEPWDAFRMPPADLFESLRVEINTTKVLSRGRLDIARLVEHGLVRWCRDGERPYPVDVDADHVLGVKFPAFWRYLDRLPNTKFLVCLRHPKDVVRSFRKTGGALGSGLDYDIPFNRRMNTELRAATADSRVRRVLLYDYINKHVIGHLDRPNVFPVHYERWFEEPRQLLDDIGEFLGVDLAPSRATLRPPQPYAESDPSEDALLQRYCHTARSLGYELH